MFVLSSKLSEAETMQSVKAVYREYNFSRKFFVNFSIGLLHGRMKNQEKTSVLKIFGTKKAFIFSWLHPLSRWNRHSDATVIVIEAADRFGLGQLHQLRGRVGRGEKTIILSPLTENESEDSLGS